MERERGRCQRNYCLELLQKFYLFLKAIHHALQAVRRMLISDLQNRLRVLVRERIAAGELTGTELANRAGFQQAHVSNFLNGRRGLSIESMDRVMEVMRLEVQDLMPDAHRKMTRRRRSGIRFGSGGGAVRAVAERVRVGRDCGVFCASRRPFCGGCVRRWRASAGTGSGSC